MRLRGIIFDFDGTLADTWTAYDSAFATVTRHFLGREIPFEERIKNKGADEIDFVRKLVPESPDEAARMFVVAFEDAHRLHVEPFPELGSLLDALSVSGTRLGVVSAKAHESAEIAFATIPIRHYFDPVITGTGWTGGKAPNISNVVAEWGLPPEQVAYVGDSGSDMTDANRAGVYAIGAAWDSLPFAVSTPRELSDAGARVVFNAPGQLAEWISSRL